MSFFFLNVIIHCWCYLFLIFFMQNQSVCMFTLIFFFLCWYLAFFFQTVDYYYYYCLMLLWLQTVPRNKKKNCCSQKKNPLSGCWTVAWLSLSTCRGAKSRRRHRRRDRSRLWRRIIHPITLSHPLSITSMSSFIVLKVVSLPFKWGPEPSRSSLSFTYRSLCKCLHCSSMQQGEEAGRKHLLKKKKKRVWSRRLPWRNGSGFPFWVGPLLWSCAAKWDSAQAYGPGYEPLNGGGTCFRSPFLHRPYFVQMGLHRAGH